MRRLGIIITLALSFLAVSVHAQDSGQMAASAYAQANYDDAAQLYDMAASLASDSALRTQYYSMAKKSRECKSLTSRAASLYASGDYEGARSVYSRILSLNPSDKTAKSRLSAIDSRVAKQKATQKQDNAYAAALKSILFHSGAMDVSALEAFVKKYPKDSRVELIRKMVAHLGSQTRVTSAEEVDYYVAAGKEFFAVSNYGVASYLFNCAAPYASTDALYYKALMLEKVSEGYKTLLAMAAAAGHKEAKTLVENIKYNKIAAQVYYAHLKNHQKDLESAVFVFVNQERYYIPSLDPLAYIMSRLPSDLEHLMDYDDGLLYYLATSGKISDRELCQNMILAAAAKGNADAMKEYAFKYAEATYKDALYLFAYVGGVESAVDKMTGAYSRLKQDEAKIYIDMLSGKDISADDAFDLYLSAWYHSTLDQHETLYVAALMADSDYTFKEFKTFWKYRKHLMYDEEFLAGLRSDLIRRSSESQYYAKVLKILSKAKVQKGCYDENAARYLVSIFDVEDLHRTRSMSKTFILN